MEVSSLGNFASAQKQTTETSSTEGSKNASLVSASNKPQGTEEARTNPIPPVNETGELSGEEGNTATPESGSGGVVDLLT